ncbi:hypothetical protein [Asticcacaulis solisilvae]|uniref:hypothetical protein n=1 Tax=Asticcacaulis solisilvae TaxID=1217274 RepID=UPI003FD7C04A
MRLSTVTAIGLALCLAAPAGAETITAKRWAAFLDSSVKFNRPDAGDFEYQLYDAAKKNKTIPAALGDFAKRLHLPADRAQAYAEFLVDETLYFEDCDNHCAFGPDVPIYGETARVAMTEPTGGLMAAVGKNTDGDMRAPFVRLAWTHPAAAAVFFDLYDYTEDSALLKAALLKLPDDPSAMPVPRMGKAFSGRSDEIDGTLLAVLDLTEKRLADSPQTVEWRAALGRFAVEQALWLGLDQEAADRYLGYSDAVRARMLAPMAVAHSQENCGASVPEAFIDRLAAALWATGRPGDARALLKGRTGVPGPVRQALSDTFDAAMPEKDIFAAYVEGSAKKPDDKDDDRCRAALNSGAEGWVFALNGETPAVRRAVAERLRAADYGDIADWVMRAAAYEEGDRDAFSLPADAFPADFAARRDVWKARIDEVRAKAAKSPPRGVRHVVTTQLPSVLTEKPLPAGVAAWTSKDEAAGPGLPKGLKLPVPADAVIRYQASGKDAAIVYESSEYDLSGEIPAAGLWLALRRDGAWQPPVYLGLQTHFPYVATSGSRLPLISNGRLQLEVRIQEIDKASITFPPVGLRYAREARGLYLDASLADLEADRDHDGLADIEEARLGLDPAKADSDGDGIPDGVDALPLTAFNPAADARDSAVARIILERLAGHDAGALVVAPRTGKSDDDIAAVLAAAGKPAPHPRRNTLIMVSDRDIFSGIAQAPFRLVVYSNADLEALGRKDAPFYPPRIVDFFVSHDRSTYYVNWSASWVGGAFIARCKDDACTVEEVSSWIT